MSIYQAFTVCMHVCIYVCDNECHICRKQWKMHEFLKSILKYIEIVLQLFI